VGRGAVGKRPAHPAGAWPTPALRAGASVADQVKVKRAKLADLSPDEHNANRGTPRGRAVLDKSLQELGAGRSILVDRNGRIIAGNKTHEAAAGAGLED